jgi:SAM-dependent methyltransferase
MSEKENLKIKILSGERIFAEEALMLFNLNLIELACLANERRKMIYPFERAGFIIDRIINYTNVREAMCLFCASHARAGLIEPYEMSLENILLKVKELTATNASVLPFKVSSFDFITIAFGIRNIPDIEKFLSESERALKKNGRLLILELTRPDNRFYRILYKFYLGRFLPFIGGIVSRDKSAFKYLAKTIETFIDPETLTEMIISKGFSEVKLIKKTFGTATIFYCKKKLI